MANYDIPTPANLDSLDVTTPLGSEDPEKLDEVLRQTRSLLKDVFLKEHNTDGTHRGPVGTVFAQVETTGKITGDQIESSPSNDAQRAIGSDHIKDNAIIQRHISTGAVGEDELATDSVTTPKIKNLNVTEAKLADDAVTTPKIAAKAVTGAELSFDATDDALRAVSTNHLKDLAVTSGKLADGSVTAAKMFNVGANKILVGNGANVTAAPVAGDLTMALVGGEARFTFNQGSGALSWARVEATLEDNFIGGVPVFVQRPGSNGTWSLKSPASGWLSISGQNLTLQAGTYWVRWGAYGKPISASNNGLLLLSRLWNNTGGGTIAFGDAVWPELAGVANVRIGVWSYGSTLFTIPSAINVTLQCFVNTQVELTAYNNPGFGIFSSGAWVEFIKI